MSSTGVRKTLSDSAIYGLGKALQQSVGLLMLPIYTRYLDPSDYGTLSLLTVAVHTVAAFFGLEVVTAMFRYYFETDSERERRSLVATTLIISVAIKLITTIAIISFSPVLAHVFLADSGLGMLVALFAITVITDITMFVPLEYLRILNRPVTYVTVSFVRLFSQLSLNVWFLAFMGLGVKGVVYSNIISGTVIGLSLVIWTLRRTGISYSKKAARMLVTYSWPLVISGLLTFYAHQIGPIALTHTWGLAQVGLLSLALKFDSVTRLLVMEPLMQSWGPLRFKIYKQDNAKEIYQRVFTVFVVAIIGMATTVSVLSTDVLRIMADEKYWSAASFIPLACLFSVSQSLYQFCGFSVLVKDRTGEVAKAMGIMGTVVTLVLFLELEKLGAIAVILALVAGSSTSAFWVYWKGAHYYDMQLPWLRFWTMLVIGLLVFYVSSLIETGTFIGFFARILILGVFYLSIFFSPIIGPEGRGYAYELASRIIRKISRIRNPPA